MATIKVRGRNDMDLPDQMKVHIDTETGEVAFKFDGVVKSFTINDDKEITAFFNIVQELLHAGRF